MACLIWKLVGFPLFSDRFLNLNSILGGNFIVICFIGSLDLGLPLFWGSGIVSPTNHYVLGDL